MEWAGSIKLLMRLEQKVPNLIEQELKRIEEIWHLGEPTVNIKKFAEYVKNRKPEHSWQKYFSLREGNTYVEAGAYWGTSGIAASKAVGSTGKVLLIEPSPRNFEILKEVVLYHDLKNVAVSNRAVWNYKMIKRFNVEDIPTAHKIDSKGIEIQADTLDNILWENGLESVDLLAADVEDAEVEMIGGCITYLSQKRIKNLAVGVYHSSDNFKSIAVFLRNFGFKNILLDTTEQGVVYSSLEE